MAKASAPPGNTDPDLARPAIVALPLDLPEGARFPTHQHRRAQLVFAVRGVMSVETCDGTWIVPPERAVWVPGGTPHALRMVGEVAIRTLYLDEKTLPPLPERCCVVQVSPLLRELVLRVVELGFEYEESGAAGRLVGVLLDEIRAMEVAPLHLPLPSDARLKRVTDALRADPSDSRPLAALAIGAGASARTLARLFERELGMSFGRWRRQLHLHHALQRLAAKEPVTRVALELGYESPSAFIAMFRRSLGATPSRYFSTPREATEPE